MHINREIRPSVSVISKDPRLVNVSVIRVRVSEILCVGHNMRSIYAPQTQELDA